MELYFLIKMKYIYNYLCPEELDFVQIELRTWTSKPKGNIFIHNNKILDKYAGSSLISKSNFSIIKIVTKRKNYFSLIFYCEKQMTS